MFQTEKRGEQQRAVTAFIKEANAMSRTHANVEKYCESDHWESRLTLKHRKCGNNYNISNDLKDSKGFLKSNGNSDGSSKIADQKCMTNGDSGNRSSNLVLGDISSAVQKINKSSDIVMDDQNAAHSTENGCLNLNKIAYIDEDEHVGDSHRALNMQIDENPGGQVNGGSNFRKHYKQGNSIQEIRALNDSDVDEVMMKKLERENFSTLESNITNDQVRKNAETNISVDVQEKHDENPFTYSAGQLRLHGNRVGTYDMQKSRTLGVKRDVLTTDVSITPGNTSSSVLAARDLIPAQFDGCEIYAKGLLNPTEDTRLIPQQRVQQQQQQEQQTNVENEMANLKIQRDKCAIAKRRKENKKAKEAKNSYVVESKDGYMGNLSPEEILKRIEGDSKGRAKGNQKNGPNGSKDHSSIVTNSSKNTTAGGRKKSDKKDRQTDKALRRFVITDEVVVDELSVNMEKMNIEKRKTVNVEKSSVTSKHGSSVTETATEKTKVVASSPQSDKVEEVGSDTTGAVKGTIDEGVDIEEQYLSADEGPNSNSPDDIYHTDEQSGACGSRDFISDGANYRADDEEINVLPVTSEESEFIQVTARSKRRSTSSLTQRQQQTSGMDRRNVIQSTTTDRGAGTNVRRDADRPRRSSVQSPPENRRNQPSSRGDNSSSPPVDSENFQKHTVRRPMFISEIIDSILMKMKEQEKKVNGRKGQTATRGTSGSGQQRQQEHSKFAASTSFSKKAKHGLPSSLQTSRAASPDRHGNQPFAVKYSVAAGSLQSGSTSAVAAVSEGLSDVKQKISEQHSSTVTDAKPPAQRSWADIAKQRLFDNSETHSLHGSTKVEQTGYMENTKLEYEQKQKRAVSVETVGNDPKVKDYSFFFDPNEPTGNSTKQTVSTSSKTVPEITDENTGAIKPLRCSGIVLNLDGGRQVVLPESDAVTTGSPTIVDIRQRPEIETITDTWKEFMEDPAEMITYKEYKRQKEKIEEQNLPLKEEEGKGEEMEKKSEGEKEDSHE